MAIHTAMPKFNPAAVNTTDLDTTEADVQRVGVQGQEADDRAAPPGFTPDEDALAPGLDVTDVDQEAEA